MKKALPVLFISLLCAQLVMGKIKAKGYIIDMSNETIKVTFELHTMFITDDVNFRKLQYDVDYFDSTDIKKTLLPDSAREFGFFINDSLIKMRSIVYGRSLKKLNCGRGERIFLKLVIDGNMQLYKAYAYSGSTQTLVEYEVVKIKGKVSEVVYGLSFRADMTKYLSECPGLASKIQARLYMKPDLEEVVEDYNLNCK